MLQQAAPLAILPAVLQEVLQGARDEAQFERLRTLLAALPCLRVGDAASTAVQAAALYRRSIAAGYTIRSPVDCLIAASCIELDALLLHRDRDFDHLAAVDPRLRCLGSAR